MLITCQQDCRFQVVRPIQELHPSASFGVLVVFRNAYTRPGIGVCSDG